MRSGLSNQYQINAETAVAVLYNDQSVLENHHCACAFKILKCPETNLFSSLSPPEKKDIRKVIIASILATDMTCHFGLLKEFDVFREPLVGTVGGGVLTRRRSCRCKP